MIGLLVAMLADPMTGFAGWSLATLMPAAALAAAAHAALRKQRGELYRHWCVETWWLPLPSAVALSGGAVKPASEPATHLLIAAALVLLWATCATVGLVENRAVGVAVAWAVGLALLDAAATAASHAALRLGAVRRLLTDDDVTLARKVAAAASVAGSRELAGVARVRASTGYLVIDESGEKAAMGSKELAPVSEEYLRSREAAAGDRLREAELHYGMLGQRAVAARARKEQEGEQDVDETHAATGWAEVIAAEGVLIEAHRERVACEVRLVAELLQAADAADEAERRDLLLFANSGAVGVIGAAALNAELATLSDDERAVLEAAAAPFREERERRRRLADLHAEEESLAAEMRACASKAADARRWRLEQSITTGSGRTRELRRHLRDAVGRARVSASTLKDICEALRGAGCAPPPEAPAAPVDVEDVAAQSEMAEAAELDAVRREAAARPLASVDPVAGATEQSDEARLTARIEHFRQLKAARAAEDEKEGARQDALVKRVRASLAADEARLQQELAKMTEYESTLSTRQTEAAASLAQGEAALGPSREAEARNAGKARRALAEKRRREEKAARRGREQADAQRARKADIQLRGVGAGDPWELLVQPLVKQAVAGEPWDDYVFPAADPSLPPSKFGARWENAAQVFSSISVFADGGGETDPVETSDIVQGALGTSYLMSALAIAASRPQLIRDCFVTKEPNDAGLYCVRLFRDGAVPHPANPQLARRCPFSASPRCRPTAPRDGERPAPDGSRRIDPALCLLQTGG